MKKNELIDEVEKLIVAIRDSDIFSRLQLPDEQFEIDKEKLKKVPMAWIREGYQWLVRTHNAFDHVLDLWNRLPFGGWDYLELMGGGHNELSLLRKRIWVFRDVFMAKDRPIIFRRKDLDEEIEEREES